MGQDPLQRIVHTLNTELPDQVLIDFLLTVKAVTLIFISGRCSASSPHMRIQRGNRGSVPSLENYKNIGFLSNNGPDPLKIT